MTITKKQQSIIETIEKKLQNTVGATAVRVINNSAAHADHGDFDGFSHITIEVVSPKFSGLGRLQQHRMVLDCLADEVVQIHSVSLRLSTE